MLLPCPLCSLANLHLPPRLCPSSRPHRPILTSLSPTSLARLRASWPQVWMLLRRIKVGQLLRQVKQRLVPVRWVIRQVRRTGTVLNWATVPLRLPIRAARRAVSQRNALRKAEAAKRAARIGSVFAAGFASKAMLAA